jgi:acetyltransferase
MEALGDAPAFFAAVRRVLPDKPIIVVRGGRLVGSGLSETGVCRAAGGRNDYLEEAFRQTGVLRVETMGDLFCMAGMLATQPTPRGRRLAILSNAGGLALVAADALVEGGGRLAELTPDTTIALNRLFQGHWSRHHPITVGETSPERFAQAAALVSRDPNSDALLVILAPQAALEPSRAAQALVHVARTSRKLILVSWLWGAADQASLATFDQAGLPNFPCPNAAVRAFGHLCRQDEYLRDLLARGRCPDLEVNESQNSSKERYHDLAGRV